MTITATRLTRAAGICAAIAGLIFIAVQIKHPPMDVASVTTTQWVLRSTAKAVMAALALAGITGMYLRQVRQTRVLGLVGYLLFAAGYLAICPNLHEREGKGAGPDDSVVANGDASIDGYLSLDPQPGDP